jgi:hypothetical protein
MARRGVGAHLSLSTGHSGVRIELRIEHFAPEGEMHGIKLRLQSSKGAMSLNRPFCSVYFRNIFLAALVSSLLLMASGLFIGVLGIDDEYNALGTAFDGTGRGLWAQHLITILLPGRLGITFAPAALGCVLYAVSVGIVVYLWGPLNRKVGYASAALIGSFPYFASMMTFDVAQVAYPIGFVLITACLIPVFESRRLATLGLSILAFSIAFACYQGVAATFATAWASIAGMRYLLAKEKNVWLGEALRTVVPRTLATAGLGSLFYLLSVRVSQAVIPHTNWGENYQVKTSFSLWDPGRLAQIYDNAVGLLMGRSGDLPFIAAALLLVGISATSLIFLFERGLKLPGRALVTLLFLASVFVLPFWILFAQSMPLAPRSAVGLGVLYGYIFAALATKANRWALAFLAGCAGIIMIQFIFNGNQMYYTQFLASQADQMTLARVATRIDSVAKEGRLRVPIHATFVGRYVPAGGQFVKYDTIGSSSLDWDSGSIDRQASLFGLYGVDGISIDRDPTLREEVVSHIRSEQIPRWPDPGSVFLYKGELVVVNFGAI